MKINMAEKYTFKFSNEISEDFNKRELDVLLSSGEQITSALLSGALLKLNVKNINTFFS